MAGGAQFEFRAVSKTAGRTAMSGRNQSEFWISDANRAKLVDTVSGIFREELSKAQGWEAAQEAGPDVLILRGALLDIVSFIPPEMKGRHEIYLSSVGQATLIVEGVHSMSGEVVFRTMDRRSAGADRMVRANRSLSALYLRGDVGRSREMWFGRYGVKPTNLLLTLYRLNSFAE